MFREKDTRDELGIGTIRDAISEILFPGTGTMQTRVRYFLFIPWLYKELEEKSIPSSNIKNKMRHAEIQLIEALAASGDEDGLIGKRSRGELKRLPSNIYWYGLGKWGIRYFNGSQDSYDHFLDRYYRLCEKTPIKDEETKGSSIRPNWHPRLPPSPDDFPEKADFKLTFEEADYLRDRLQTNCPESLLAWLADNGKGNQDIDYAWQNPQYEEFPVSIQNHLKHAKNFSEIMHGSSLLYNLMLAQQSNKDDLESQYREDIKDWVELIDTHKDNYISWNQDAFWSLIGIKYSIPVLAKRFAMDWIRLALTNAKSIISDRNARNLIVIRESNLKHKNARLTNLKARELWNGAAGVRQLDFRWFVAQRQIADIQNGLKR